MSIGWFGRVFGWSGAPGSTTPEGSLEQLRNPSPVVVDSDELAAELARARRYEHDLAIVVLLARPIDSRPSADLARTDNSKLPQMIALLTAVALREALRHSDVVCYQAAQNRFILALAESDTEDASHALERLRAQFRSRLRLSIEAGVAHFPEDALTLDELVHAAGARLGGVASVVPHSGRSQRNGRRPHEPPRRGSERGPAGRRA